MFCGVAEQLDRCAEHVEDGGFVRITEAHRNELGS